jgi:2-aminoadipate transaminase
VLVTTGGTQGLAALGAALLEPGQSVAAQSPTYLGALDAWRARQPVYRPMDLEDPGFDPRPDMAAAQFAYTVPNFSNPSGRLVDVAQRRALLQAAQDTGCWLVEDDPYGGLFYDAPPLPSLLELSATGTEAPYDGPVIYLGTVSKELAPGLRIGWVIAAPEAIAALSAAKQGMDMFSSGLCQVITALALDRGLMAEAQETMCALYRTRRDAFCDALERHLAGEFTWTRPSGGMFVWARARDTALDTDALMRAGLEEGVCLSPSSVFDPAHKDRSGMRLNFTLNPPDRLEEGAARLARAVKRLRRAAA